MLNYNKTKITRTPLFCRLKFLSARPTLQNATCQPMPCPFYLAKDTIASHHLPSQAKLQLPKRISPLPESLPYLHSGFSISHLHLQLKTKTTKSPYNPHTAFIIPKLSSVTHKQNPIRFNQKKLLFLNPGNINQHRTTSTLRHNLPRNSYF